MSGKRWTCAHDDHESVHDSAKGFTPCPACRPYPMPPVDWPARFRAAAEEAAPRGLLQQGLRQVALSLELQEQHVVEAIGRKLSGEEAR